MIAHRFRPIGWVAGVATAATALYLVSLQVAVERAKLDDVERRITGAHRDMRALQTELGTRASLRQLERYNGEVLALAAPAATQYVQEAAQLASLNLERSGPINDAPPAVMLASVRAAPSLAPVQTTAVPDAQPRFQRATYTKPDAPVQVERVAMLSASRTEPSILKTEPSISKRERSISKRERSILDRGTLGDLADAAARERRRTQ